MHTNTYCADIYRYNDASMQDVLIASWGTHFFIYSIQW